MTVELSCGLPPGPDFSDLAVAAETLGYSRVWIFGSAPLWEDPFVHLALAAERTSRIGLGTAVLDPARAVGDGHGVGDRDHRPALRWPIPGVLRHRPEPPAAPWVSGR